MARSEQEQIAAFRAFLNVMLFGCFAFICWMVGMVVYETYGAEPIKRQAADADWRKRCTEGGNTLIPTKRRWTKRGDVYDGWVCAKITKVAP